MTHNSRETFEISVNTARALEPRLLSLAKSFLASEDTSKGSKKTYSMQIHQFMHWLTDIRKAFITELSFQDLLGYKQYLIDQRLSPYTISGYITVVRKLFSWLEVNKMYPNIALRLKGLKKPRGFRKDALTLDQIHLLLSNINRRSIKSLRNFAMINLMLRTGLRMIEVSRACVGDVREVAGEGVLWVQGKGRDCKDEVVVLVSETLGPILEYLQKRGKVTDSQPLFANLYDAHLMRPLEPRRLARSLKRL